MWGWEKGLESGGQPKEPEADFNRLPFYYANYLKMNNLSVVTTTKHPEPGARLPQTQPLFRQIEAAWPA